MPSVNLLGVGEVKEVGQRIKSLGYFKALIVTDAGLFKFGVANRGKNDSMSNIFYLMGKPKGYSFKNPKGSRVISEDPDQLEIHLERAITTNIRGGFIWNRYYKSTRGYRNS